MPMVRKLANSDRFALPSRIAPAARSFATTGESLAGTLFSSATEPAVVGMPAASRLSLTITGMQRAANVAGGALGVHLRGLVERPGVEAADGVDRRALGVGQRDPLEVGLRQLRRGQRAGGHPGLQVGECGGLEREVERDAGRDLLARGTGARVAGVAAPHRRVDLADRLAQLGGL